MKDSTIVKDKDSGALRLPHRLDETTGMYRGKQIVSTEELKRREARGARRAKQAAAEEHRHANLESIPAHAEIHSEKEEKKEGILGRFTKGRAKARSGFGGGA